MIELYPHQKDLLQKAEEALVAYTRVMLQLPTGGGKTLIAAALLDGWVRRGAKAAWLTHRRELCTQTYKALNKFDIPAADRPRWDTDDPAPSIEGGVVILMVQTVSKHNLVWDEYGSEDLLVIDEAHHAPARSWNRAIDQWPGRVIGLTATPWRSAKHQGFAHLFHDLILGPQISDMQSKNQLAKAQVVRPTDDDLILVGIPARNGEYREDEIERLNRDRHIWTGGTLEYWQKHAEGRQTIVYAVSTGHAENLIKVFKDAGIHAAAILSGTRQDERTRVIQQFSDRTLKVLVNVDVATEGFDLPDASCIVLARPTTSLALYLQMVGRGLRPKGGGDCLILDLAGNSKRHRDPDDERHWSLEPRGQQGEGEPPPQVWCPKCHRLSPAASHNCWKCGNPFGKDCPGRCGRWRAWKDWNAETYCGGDHDLVCDRCHPDAHIVPKLPEGLKEMLRKEPVDSETKLNFSDLHTGEAARDLLCEVMENLIYAKKVDDTGAFIRILEKQLKPLLRKEKQLRNADLEKMTAELETAMTPALLDFKADLEKIYEGRRKVTEIMLSLEKGIAYQWEENGEVHSSDWSPWSQDELGLLGQQGVE